MQQPIDITTGVSLAFGEDPTTAITLSWFTCASGGKPIVTLHATNRTETGTTKKLSR